MCWPHRYSVTNICKWGARIHGLDFKAAKLHCSAAETLLVNLSQDSDIMITVIQFGAYSKDPNVIRIMSHNINNSYNPTSITCLICNTETSRNCAEVWHHSLSMIIDGLSYKPLDLEAIYCYKLFYDHCIVLASPIFQVYIVQIYLIHKLINISKIGYCWAFWSPSWLANLTSCLSCALLACALANCSIASFTNTPIATNTIRLHKLPPPIIGTYPQDHSLKASQLLKLAMIRWYIHLHHKSKYIYVCDIHICENTLNHNVLSESSQDKKDAQHSVCCKVEPFFSRSFFVVEIHKDYRIDDSCRMNVSRVKIVTMPRYLRLLSIIWNKLSRQEL